MVHGIRCLDLIALLLLQESGEIARRRESEAEHKWVLCPVDQLINAPRLKA